MIDAVEMHIVDKLDVVEDLIYDIQLLSGNAECQSKRILISLRSCLKKARELEAAMQDLKYLYVSDRNQRRLF